jgi:hypothetical protein
MSHKEILIGLHLDKSRLPILYDQNMRAKLVFRDGMRNYVAMMTTGGGRADFVNI